MTGPATGEPGAGARAPLRTSGMRDTARAIGTLLAVGLALRVIIAYQLPGSGFGVDLNAFRYWANDLAQHGPPGFYGRGFFADYTPGYLYVLWLVGLVGQATGGIGDLIKIPSILADLAVGWLIWRLVLDLGGSQRRALVGAALFVFNPITWFDSTIWGQVDSFGVIFLLLGLRELWRDHPERAALLATVAAIIKPQLGILIPIVAVVVLRRYFVDSGADPARPMPPTGDLLDDEPEGADSAGPVEADGMVLPVPSSPQRRARGPLRVLTTAATGLLTAVVLCLPFGISIIDLARQILATAGGYPYLTVNAYNPWALLVQGDNGLAANGLWIRDVGGGNADEVAFMFGPVPAVVVGSALLLLVIIAVAIVVARRPDRLTVLIGLTLLSVAFFVLPTRVHERYMFPFFALGAILAAVSGRWLVAYVALSAVNFANLYVVLTTLYPNNPGISDWLGIGPGIRSTTTIVLIALVHLAGFLWISSELRGRAQRRLLKDIDRSRLEDEAPPSTVLLPGPIGASGGTGPAPGLPATAGPYTAMTGSEPAPGRDWAAPPRRGEAGAWAAITRWVLGRPLRADRSRALHGESGGRFDRLDAWLMIVLVVASLALRTFRLSEPSSMHFDEVYHARTATEFLQDWRYGMPHDIYEYTHPHLAKYAMAAGIVLLGNDQLTSTADLGVPVRDAIVEQRWDDPALPGARAGDRVYVATPDGVRAYDLATRALVGTITVEDPTTLALDQTAHRLYIGTGAGDVSVVETRAAFDDLRFDPGAPTTGPPAPFASLGSAIRAILAPPSSPFVEVATAGDDLVSVDAQGTEVARVHLPGIRELEQAGTSQQVVAQPAQVTDPAAAASLLAGFLGGDAAGLRSMLEADASSVVLGAAPQASVRASLDAAIADGRLPGVNVQILPQIVAVDNAGLSFVVPSTATVVQTLTVEGATGIASVSGFDSPRLYVAAGTRVLVVRIPSDPSTGAGATIDSTLTAPGPVERVAFDPSSTFVHVVGRTPDGASPTVYVIEPHGNAFFADAKLPFEAAALAVDAQPLYPSQDRQQLLVLSADGGIASVAIGGNPFAWRFPGVLLGALTAGLLYLMARMLFQRRSIGVLAAIFVLAEGMAFVQSRIGMNDVYVGFFVIAAYVLFAAIWLRAPRTTWAFWVAMPVIGLLLGLALASKWVGLYALAGIGILILARSALGRLLIVLAMIAGTTVLGYMGLIVPPGGTSGGNLAFMLIMIGLTLAAVMIAVLHPVAWSAEEVRFAIGGPPAIGILVLLVAIPIGKVGMVIALGPLKLGVPTIALGLVLLGGLVAIGFWLAGWLGFGPLAPPIPPEVERRAAPASPAPEGWLRLGSGFGVPAAWMAASLLVVPIVIYVVSYLPWVALGNRLTDDWPPGNNGQTIIQLTQSMYDYHNNLRAAHPASSPWWAWPLDLKPVWFYQGSFAGNTAASIYDAGNLVIWWLAIPAMAFSAWQAYRRRSLALGLIVLAFAWQWLPWVRIDRATFQYHFYTSVPFIILGLSYFLAELWHGASRHTWLLAKVAAAAAVVGPAVLWIGRGPLCGFVRVDVVNPGSQACTGNPGNLVVTAQVAALVLIVVIAVVVILYLLLHLDRSSVGESGGSPPAAGNTLMRLLGTVLAAAIAIVVAQRFVGEGVVFQVQGFESSYLALMLAIPLVLIALFILTARDARRFVAGAGVAAVVAFLVVYPNISALPLPSTIVNAYQGLLPTYLYPFQFPVNTDPAAPGLHLLSLEPAVLLVALTITSLVVGYAAWVWRIGPPPEPPAGEGGLATTGGQA